ncbi:SDR family oxidoreductase [Candidatus Pacearchaeota archaeon]|nr:SDR family oxidoreductase [Candidatus Pacearchaeota archaeon]
MNKERCLEGKTALITGSSRGIGAATARLFKEYGANVILHGRTESCELKGLAKEIDSNYIYCDAGELNSVVKKIESLNSNIDILINNAGIARSKNFWDLDSRDWREVFDANVLGVVNFSKAVIPGMIERKYGKIVNVSSIKGFPSNAGSSAYAASKAAVINLTASMANQYAPNIFVNCVAPGFTKTEMTNQTWSSRIKRQVDEIPLKRMAEPREIAETIVFLSSDKSSYITGQTIIVDGGLVISN